LERIDDATTVKTPAHGVESAGGQPSGETESEVERPSLDPSLETSVERCHEGIPHHLPIDDRHETTLGPLEEPVEVRGNVAIEQGRVNTKRSPKGERFREDPANSVLVPAK
jgi:hypothetical protein